MDAGKYVHEYVDGNGARWWVVAEHEDGCYYAPMKPRYCAETGFGGAFGSLGYVAGRAYTYRTRRAALRRARQLYDSPQP